MSIDKPVSERVKIMRSLYPIKRAIEIAEYRANNAAYKYEAKYWLKVKANLRRAK